MATTTPTPPHQHFFTNHPFTAVAAPPPRTDHLNMINLRDVVFLSPPPPPHHQPPPPHHQPPPPPAAAVGLGVSIFPLLPCHPTTSTAATTLDFQVHPEPLPVRHGKDNAVSNLWSFSRKDAFSISRQGEANQFFGGREPMMKACRDCGNRAKRECVHRRCRTCCRSRSYDCPTHLKSTWVPAAKRRERQHQHDNYSQSKSQSQGQAFVGSSSSFPSGISKRQRVDNTSAAAAGSSASNAATPRSFDTIPCPQDANFKRSLPGKVRAPVMFRCIRVTAINDNAAEIVYQTTVTISGHVFKGFLYNQGSKNTIGCASESNFDAGARNRANDASPITDQTVLASRRLVEGE